MKSFRIAAVVSLMILATAGMPRELAAGSTEARAEVPRSQRNMPMHRGMMDFEEAEVSVADVANGVTLTFSTESGDTAQLQRRVRFMADMFNRQPATPRRGGMMGDMMVSATANVEDLPDGARLTLEPRDAGDLDTLRNRVRLMADRMESSGSMTMAGMMMAGPMQLAGADVEVSDVPDGVAAVFSADSRDVEQLQRRVEEMAAMFDAETPGAARGRGGRGMMGRGMMLQATATVERLENGVRLTLEPEDPAQLARLRMHVRRMVERMTASGQQ